MSGLFVQSAFTSHAGLPLLWKIEADALSPDDWRAIASFVGPSLAFRSVQGIPRGGLAFAEALEPYASDEGGVLLVDDVLTTGGSMEEARSKIVGEVRGVVLFSRSTSCPDWIMPVFSLHPVFADSL